LRDDWREYWERRPGESGDFAWLGHGNVVELRKNAEEWHRKRFAEALRPDTVWIMLDAGCGAGDEILRFHDSVRQMVGMDFSVKMLKVCRERLKRLGVSNAVLIAGDTRALPFKSGVFDGCLCMGVLQFMDGQDAELAVKELSRVTTERMLLHGKNSFSPFGLQLRLAENLFERVRNRLPYDHHRPLWWYRRMFGKFGCLNRQFTIGLWVPQLPDDAKSIVGSVEILASSLGLNHPFGKEYYVVVSVKGHERERSRE
jgi:SAM-dependent methyltransferase